MPSGVRTADTCWPAPPHAEQVLALVPGFVPLPSHVPHLDIVHVPECQGLGYCLS